MTEDRVGNIAKALGTVIAVIIIMLAIVAHAFGQENKDFLTQENARKQENHDHKGTSFKRFDSIRVTPPAKITGIIHTEQGERIEWVSYDKHEIRNGSFTLSKDTEKDAKVKEKVWVWIVFCTDDQYVYAVYPLTAIQERAMKP